MLNLTFLQSNFSKVVKGGDLLDREGIKDIISYSRYDQGVSIQRAYMYGYTKGYEARLKEETENEKQVV